MGTTSLVWNHVIPDSAVKVLLTLPRREVWMPIRVSGDKSISADRVVDFPPGNMTLSEDNVETPARDSMSGRGLSMADEGLRAGLEIASRVESISTAPVALGKRFT